MRVWPTAFALLALIGFARAQSAPPSWCPALSGLPTPNGDVSDLTVGDDGTGVALYACGNFTSAGGVAVDRVFQWDGASVSPVGTGLPYPGVALTWVAEASGPVLYASDVAQLVHRFDGVTWSNIGYVTYPGCGCNSIRVADMLAFDDGSGSKLYATGFFTQMNGQTARNIAVFDGASWSEVGGGFNSSGTSMVVFDDGTGSALYVGGWFTLAGGMPANRVAKWNGVAWSALGSGPSHAVLALAVHDDGLGPKLYAGGVGNGSISVWDGTSWSLVGGGTNGDVISLASFDDGASRQLYACGSFGVAGGVDVAGSARWNGSSWWRLSPFTYRASTMAPIDLGSGPELFLGTYWGNELSPIDELHLAKLKQAACPPLNTLYCVGNLAHGINCPCGNMTPSNAAGCLNSTLNGAELSSSGTASLATDTLQVFLSFVPAGAPTLLFQGTTRGGFTFGFGDGELCTAGTITRIGVKFADGSGSAHWPGAGDAVLSVAGLVPGSGSYRFYQAYYRDAASYCTIATHNISNGVYALWLP